MENSQRATKLLLIVASKSGSSTQLKIVSCGMRVSRKNYFFTILIVVILESSSITAKNATPNSTNSTLTEVESLLSEYFEWKVDTYKSHYYIEGKVYIASLSKTPA